MTTALDVVNQAFKKAGLLGDGQAMSGSDTQDGLTDLGDLLGLWNEKRWLVWHLLDFAFTSDGRTTAYTVGPNGNFNMNPRPSRLEAAYIVQNQVAGGYPVSTPLEIIQSFEEYSRLPLKTLVSFPQYAFLDTASPLANLKLNPWPNASIYTIRIVVKDVYPVVLQGNTSFANYPPMTIPAMKFNLARWFRQAYGKGLRPDPELNVLGQDALDTMRAAQVQVPELVMPRMLIAAPNGYNIFSDRYW